MTEEMDPVIDFYKHIKDVLNSLDVLSTLGALDEHRVVLMKSDLDSNYKKALVLAAASYYEDLIMRIITDLVNKHTNNNDIVYSFIKNKAMARQYHTYFNWREKNTRQFIGLFGSNFSKEIRIIIDKRTELQEAENAFMDISSTRNVLIHGNYIENEAVKDKTVEEVYVLYKKGRAYVDFLRKIFIDEEEYDDAKL
ncbi:HEPN domain-containing protein [Candidatus Magnetominusculus xianensis]|uniref:RiboL-PSP-HEPN domain-containing protein n=1 Tax=Candidatus Magnetominusculus xianensis TaxID=1748249 RepID=A0ABR5SCS7_9BACT|nr:HEPN domain-containing protein [Candidatus Magnetominusculus xianensis]KWT82468.1 hypothetical protein ASN18_2500 [Candidatus Magnetominusculus xianensis]MBF0403188.1 hypothetical protein [Nitrospirota bacterium]